MCIRDSRQTAQIDRPLRLGQLRTDAVDRRDPPFLDADAARLHRQSLRVNQPTVAQYKIQQANQLLFCIKVLRRAALPDKPQQRRAAEFSQALQRRPAQADFAAAFTSRAPKKRAQQCGSNGRTPAQIRFSELEARPMRADIPNTARIPDVRCRDTLIVTCLSIDIQNPAKKFIHKNVAPSDSECSRLRENIDVYKRQVRNGIK